MRKIKFKVNCKKHNREEIYTLGDLIMGRATTKNGEGGIFENWRQYTGLHDKNGKEIYEEDIVKIHKHNFDFGFKQDDIGQIKFIDGSFGFYREISKKEYYFNELATENGYGELDYYEVIGNIYDNPELLERSSNGD